MSEVNGVSLQINVVQRSWRNETGWEPAAGEIV